MKISFLISALLIWQIQVYAQLPRDTIQWRPEYKLKWSDFQGNPDTTYASIAGTSSYYFYNSRIINKKFVVSVKCIFDRSKSWTKIDDIDIDIDDDYILSHEQTHFNITELFARKLLVALKICTEDTMSQKKYSGPINLRLAYIKKQIDFQYKQMDEQYDRETEHSNKRRKQDEWNEKILNMINELPPH